MTRKPGPASEPMCEDQDGNLWVGTIRAGLYKLNRERIQFVRYRNNTTDPASLASNEIASLFEDREGGMWVGTRGDGADRFTRKPLLFRRYAHEPGNPNSIGRDVVIAVFEDSHGILWLAGSRKLLALDRQTGKHYRFIQVPGEMVYSIAEDSSGFLWFGAVGGGGLSRFDRRTGKIKTYRHDKENPRSLSNDEVRSLLIDHKGTLWAGTDDGLNCLRPANRGVHGVRPASETEHVSIDRRRFQGAPLAQLRLDWRAPVRSGHGKVYRLPAFG